MSDKTKADLVLELDAMKQKMAKAEASAITAEKKAAMAEMKLSQKILSDPVNQAKPKRAPQDPYQIQPDPPINDMTKLQYHAWRIKLLTGILASKAGRLTPEMRTENEATLFKEEQHLIKWHGETLLKHPDHAGEYDDQVKSLIKKHPKIK